MVPQYGSNAPSLLLIEYHGIGPLQQSSQKKHGKSRINHILTNTLAACRDERASNRCGIGLCRLLPACAAPVSDRVISLLLVAFGVCSM